jgi:hypothetical protein
VNFQTRPVQGEEIPCDLYIGGGFVVVAHPARYGVSGGMSFLVKQDGVVYEQNLCKKMMVIASKITTFNSDDSWIQAPLLTNARSQ